MTDPDLLAQLAEVADSLLPGVAPVGHDELLQALVDTARRLFGAAACSLALLSDDEDELAFTTASGEGAAEVVGVRIGADRGVAGWVAQSAQPIAVTDLRTDPRFARDVAESTGYVPQAILAVPIQTPRRLFGVLSLLDRDAERPGASQDLQTAALFGEQAGLALESADAFRRAGGILLAAVAAAARGDGDLAAAAQEVAATRRGAARRQAELAAVLASLAQEAPADQDLAVRVLREVLSWSREQRGRSGRPRS